MIYAFRGREEEDYMYTQNSQFFFSDHLAGMSDYCETRATGLPEAGQVDPRCTRCEYGLTPLGCRLPHVCPCQPHRSFSDVIVYKIQFNSTFIHLQPLATVVMASNGTVDQGVRCLTCYIILFLLLLIHPFVRRYLSSLFFLSQTFLLRCSD